MAFDTLRDFIGAIEKRGELLRVKEKVSPILEITEWTDQTVKRITLLCHIVVRSSSSIA